MSGTPAPAPASASTEKLYWQWLSSVQGGAQKVQHPALPPYLGPGQEGQAAGEQAGLLAPVSTAALALWLLYRTLIKGVILAGVQV